MKRTRDGGFLSLSLRSAPIDCCLSRRWPALKRGRTLCAAHRGPTGVIAAHEDRAHPRRDELAILITLMNLARQVRQSNRQNMLSAFQHSHDSLNERALSFVQSGENAGDHSSRTPVVQIRERCRAPPAVSTRFTSSCSASLSRTIARLRGLQWTTSTGGGPWTISPCWCAAISNARYSGLLGERAGVTPACNS